MGSRKYTYTIISDCIGGSITIDGEYVGIVPDNGVYVHESNRGVFVYKVTHAYGQFYMGLYKDSDYNAKSKLSNIGVRNTVTGAVYITHSSFTTG